MYSRSTVGEGYRVPQNYNGIAFSREEERTEPNKPQHKKSVEVKSPISYSERADEHLFGKAPQESNIFTNPKIDNELYSNDYYLDEEPLVDSEIADGDIPTAEDVLSTADSVKKNLPSKKSKRSGDDRFLLALIFLLFGGESNENNDILPLLLLLLFLQ